MIREMGRPRSPNNKDLPKDFYPPAGGRGCYRMLDPITRNPKSLETKNKGDALELYWAIKELHKPNVKAQAASFAGGPLLSDMAERYRLERLPTATAKSKPLDKNTKKTYGNYLKNIHAATCFKCPVSIFNDVDEGPRILREYLSTWLNQPKTYNYRLSILSRLFGWLIDLGKLVRNPCDSIGHKTPGTREVYMTDEHYLLIRDKMLEMFGEVYARALDWLYLMSGRPTNMMDVKEGQILEKEINYYASKNDSPVIVERDPEIDELISWFREYKRTQEHKGAVGIASPYLIVHPAKAKRGLAKRPISADRLYRYFKRAMKAAGVTGYALRDIRPKALTDEAVLAGESTNKGAHKTKRMRDHYVKVKLPVHVKNNLKRLKA